MHIYICPQTMTFIILLNSDCVAFNCDKMRQNCFLLKNFGTNITNPSFVSGPKVCGNRHGNLILYSETKFIGQDKNQYGNIIWALKQMKPVF